MKIQLSDHFTYKRLLKFTLPSIIMMLFTSIYSVVDGIFVSNFVGSNALSSINIIYPLIIIVGAFGFMLGTGGSAEVAKTLGEGDKVKANKYFTMMILTIALIGIVISAICIIFIRPISYLLGASNILLEDCITYGTILLIGSVAFMFQTTFQSFFIVAEKPKMGLLFTILSGVTNMVLDFVFICIFKMGIAGAALATILGYAVGGILPIIYFVLPNSSLLKFTKTKFYPGVLFRSCINGSSEMVSNISMSIVTFLYNIQMMKFVGEDGVAAITVIMYVNFIFIAILIGFSIGSAPIIGYNYGAQNHTELKNMFKKCINIVLIVSASMGILAQILAVPLVKIFERENITLMEMTIHGFRLYSLAFFVCGINIFGSAFFTALCNGKLSAIISFLRALVLQSGMILLLPLVLKLDGVWLAVVFAELLTMIVTIFFLVQQRKKYQYA